MANRKTKPAGEKPNKETARAEALEKYVGEIDRFATMLRDQQQEIEQLSLAQAAAKLAYDAAKEATREAKEQEHNTVSLLLKFIRPGSIDVMPLFDSMDEADEEVHGEHASEWRKEPVTALNLSAAAVRALIDADIVLVGQLQDRLLKAKEEGGDWAEGLETLTDPMAQAIEAKLSDFIAERSK